MATAVATVPKVKASVFSPRDNVSITLLDEAKNETRQRCRYLVKLYRSATQAKKSPSITNELRDVVWRIQKSYFEWRQWRQEVGAVLNEEGYADVAMPLIKLAVKLGIYTEEGLFKLSRNLFGSVANFSEYQPFGASLVKIGAIGFMLEYLSINNEAHNGNNIQKSQIFVRKPDNFIVKCSLQLLLNLLKTRNFAEAFLINKATEIFPLLINGSDEEVRCLAALCHLSLLSKKSPSDTYIDDERIVSLVFIKAITAWLESDDRRDVRVSVEAVEALVDGLCQLCESEKNRMGLLHIGTLKTTRRLLEASYDSVRRKSVVLLIFLLSTELTKRSYASFLPIEERLSLLSALDGVRKLPGNTHTDQANVTEAVKLIASIYQDTEREVSVVKKDTSAGHVERIESNTPAQRDETIVIVDTTPNVRQTTAELSFIPVENASTANDGRLSVDQENNNVDGDREREATHVLQPDTESDAENSAIPIWATEEDGEHEQEEFHEEFHELEAGTMSEAEPMAEPRSTNEIEPSSAEKKEGVTTSIPIAEDQEGTTEKHDGNDEEKVEHLAVEEPPGPTTEELLKQLIEQVVFKENDKIHSLEEATSETQHRIKFLDKLVKLSPTSIVCSQSARAIQLMADSYGMWPKWQSEIGKVLGQENFPEITFKYVESLTEKYLSERNEDAASILGHLYLYTVGTTHSFPPLRCLYSECGLIAFLLIFLENSQKSDENPQETEHFVTAAIDILNNLSKSSELKFEFQQNRAVQILQGFLDTPSLAVDAIICLCRVMADNNESAQLVEDRGIIGAVLDYCSQAISAETGSVDIPGTRGTYPYDEMLECVVCLAASDANKKKMLECGVIELLGKLLTADNLLMQSFGVDLTWVLSFDLDVRVEICSQQEQVISPLAFLTQEGDPEVKLNAKQTYSFLDKWDELLDSAVTYRQDPQLGKESLASKRIVVSYSWQQYKTVQKMKQELTKLGKVVSPEVDKMNGTSVLEDTAKSIEGAAVVLLCFSQSYKLSSSCRAEAAYAMALGKIIVPVSMEHTYTPDGWLQATIGQSQCVDMSLHKEPMDDAVSALAREVDCLLALKGMNFGALIKRNLFVPASKPPTLELKEPTEAMLGINNDTPAAAESRPSSSMKLGSQLSSTSNYQINEGEINHQVNSEEMTEPEPEPKTEIKQSTRVHSSNSAHSNKRAPPVNKWTKEDLRKWLQQENLYEKYGKKMEEFDGERLAMLLQIEKKAPDYFFSSVSKHFDAPLPDLLQLFSALSKLSASSIMPDT